MSCCYRWDRQTNLADKFHTLKDLTEDNVLSIQPSSLDSGDKLWGALQ